MSARLNRRAALACGSAVALTLAGSAPASARNGVYGGATRAGDPIAIVTDAKGKTLKEAVFRVRVDGADDWWAIATRAVAAPLPDNPMAMRDGTLYTTRNAKGAFAATLFTDLGRDDAAVYTAVVELAGKLKPGRATGSVKAKVAVVDSTTMDAVATYTTPTIKWSAERAAGKVYAGATALNQPIVIRLNKRATKVDDLWISCVTSRSDPPGWYWSASEALSDFPLAKGRFGDVFSYARRGPSGTKVTYDWNIAGRITSTAATGKLSLIVSGSEPTGEPYTLTMPATKFTARTG